MHAELAIDPILVLLMSYALFGAGQVALVNADYYAAVCLAPWARFLLFLGGVALAGGGITWARASREGGWMGYAALTIYATWCLQGALAALDTEHRVPLALLAIGYLLSIRHSRGDSLLVPLLVQIACWVLQIWHAADPQTNDRRQPPCDTATAVLALLAAGALHALPVAVMYDVTPTRTPAPEGRLSALLVALILCLGLGVFTIFTRDGVYIPVLFSHAYVDMLIGGVSTRETVSLVMQVLVLVAVTGGTFNLMMRGMGRSLSTARLFSPEPYMLTTLVAVGTALFLQDLPYTTLVVFQWVSLGGGAALYVAA